MTFFSKTLKLVVATLHSRWCAHGHHQPGWTMHGSLHLSLRLRWCQHPDRGHSIQWCVSWTCWWSCQLMFAWPVEVGQLDDPWAVFLLLLSAAIQGDGCSKVPTTSLGTAPAWNWCTQCSQLCHAQISSHSEGLHIRSWACPGLTCIAFWLRWMSLR